MLIFNGTFDVSNIIFCSPLLFSICSRPFADFALCNHGAGMSPPHPFFSFQQQYRFPPPIWRLFSVVQGAHVFMVLTDELLTLSRIDRANCACQTWPSRKTSPNMLRCHRHTSFVGFGSFRSFKVPYDNKLECLESAIVLKKYYWYAIWKERIKQKYCSSISDQQKEYFKQ